MSNVWQRRGFSSGRFAPGAAAVLRALCLLAVAAGVAAEPQPPQRREIWIPTENLDRVLAEHPKAVLLSREEYDTLLRDASAKHQPVPKPPREAVLTSAEYVGRVQGSVMSVSATLAVEVLSDEWAHLALPFASLSLGSVRVDGPAALADKSAEDKCAASLLLHGRGEHRVTLEFSAPLETVAAGTRLHLELPTGGASSFQVELPPRSLAESKQPLRIEALPNATRLTATLPPSAAGSLDLTWRPGAATVAASLKPSCHIEASYDIDYETILATFDLNLSAPLGSLPAQLELSVPAAASVLNVTGEQIQSWSAAPGQITVQFAPGDHPSARLEMRLAQPSLAGATQASVHLPLPVLKGVGRLEGISTIEVGDDVAVREIAADPALVPLPLGAELRAAARWSFEGPAAPQVSIQRVQPRFSADLDTLVDFQPDAVHLQRTVTLHEEEGRLFAIAFTLPAGEELLDVETAAHLPWRQQGTRVSLQWSGSAPPAIKLHTRSEPPGWVAAAAAASPAAGPPVFTVADLKIEGVSRVTGYLALRAQENFRLEAEASDTLERRDGRTTPIRGAYAWFRRDDFALRVKVSRRPSEVLATLTGYALPLAGVLDVHAQIAWDFRYAGVRAVQVRVPIALAASFNFESPQLATRTLAGDTWTLTFQKELTGEQNVSVEAQIPVTRAGSDESHFSAEVPLIEPLGVKRSGGTWAIEANTDTEIQALASGMNELDALLAPALAGYQPRHRVIAVYSWLGPKYTLALSGTRHAPAETLHAIVDRLELQSVAAINGTVRTEAAYNLRNAGLQFLDVSLPPKSQLLSLLVDGDPVKPVEGRPGDVRVELSARRDTSAPRVIRLLFETAATKPWQISGQGTLPTPRLPPFVPILKTVWKTRLPEGFYLSAWEGRLAPRQPYAARPLLLAPLALREMWHGITAAAVLGSSGISDPRAGSDLPEQSRRLGERWHALVNNAPETGPFGGEDASVTAEELNAAPNAQVKQWLLDADGYFKTGRFDLASKRCEQILNTDPSNQAARRLQVEINQRRSGYAVAGKNETRSYDQWQLEKSWDRPVRKYVKADEERPETKAASPATVEVYRKLETIIIPKLEFREAGIREALEFLRQKSMALDAAEPDPARKGVNIVLQLGDARVTPPPSPSPQREAYPTEARITLSLANIPLGEALRYVTGLANLKFKVTTGGVVVVPQGVETDELVTREWQVPPGFFSFDTNVGTPVTPQALKDYLMEAGVAFPTGASATFFPGSGKISVRNTQENLDLVDAILEAAVDSPSRAKEGSRDRTSRGTAREVALSRKLQDKLDTIIIPKLEFREATIREAIDFLMQKSSTLDASDTDPATKGVNIVLKLDPASGSGAPPPPPSHLPPAPSIPGLEPVPGATAPAPGTASAPAVDAAEARITVSLSNIPLGEALRYVTGLANLKYKVEPYAVSVVPQGVPTDVLVTKEWRLPPDFFAGAPTAGGGGTGSVRRVEAKDYLVANGITFPQGASAIFLPNSSKLIVKTTQENIDRIDDLVDAHMAAPAASPQPIQSGLLPMELDLPAAGSAYAFEAFGPPDDLRFSFMEEGSRARRLWLCFVAGLIVGVVFAGRHPWWRTAWAILLLSFIPLCISAAATGVCNVLLLGWLVSIVTQRLAMRFIFAPPHAAPVEVTA